MQYDQVISARKKCLCLLGKVSYCPHASIFDGVHLTSAKYGTCFQMIGFSDTAVGAFVRKQQIWTFAPHLSMGRRASEAETNGKWDNAHPAHACEFINAYMYSGEAVRGVRPRSRV